MSNNEKNIMVMAIIPKNMTDCLSSPKDINVTKTRDSMGMIVKYNTLTEFELSFN